jgi:alcohol dehydrogenase class IV
MLNVLEIPQRIVTGWGALERIGTEVEALGQSALLIHSNRMSGSAPVSRIIKALSDAGKRIHCQPVASGEPTIQQVESVLSKAEAYGCDFVVGIGGGSVLDLSKAVAGLLFPQRLPVRDYFYGQPTPVSGVPWVAIPTTSGTGAEATPNAVLSDEKQLKMSIRGDRSWLASVVIVDPELTVSSPPNVTAWSGMDALTQAIESYTSTGANVLTEPYSLQAHTLIAKSLLVAYRHPDDRQARTDMALGSLLAGVALANARLGIVHGVAHSIGLHFDVPHGLVCGTLLPWAIEYNAEVCAEKYKTLAEQAGVGHDVADLVSWVREVNETLGIPYSIQAFGVTEEDVSRLVEESMPSGSLKANPRSTSAEELTAFLNEQLR